MEDRELQAGLVALLQRIAPEVEPGTLDAGAPLREQVDLDSMDFLNFLISVHERFGVDIPEADYEGLRTLDNLVAYLRARLSGAANPSSPA
jgi:acyl carrier protein